jgi:hypothetical protein
MRYIWGYGILCLTLLMDDLHQHFNVAHEPLKRTARSFELERRHLVSGDDVDYW